MAESVVEQLRAALGERYDVERELGHGGGATVFAARDRKHDRRVALKVLHPELAHALGGERFRREIRLVAALSHPHILALHDSGEANGFLYYVMPLVEGETLRERLDREQQLPIDDAVTIATQLADALGYAHERGVVHRDVKPENVFLAGEHALIGDFGVARLIAPRTGEHQVSTAGMVAGTPAYMSPEQASGEPHIGPQSDVYSLGCLLYEMLAGRPPFTGPNAQAVLARRFAEPAPSVRHARPRVSEELDEVVSQALALIPADRFASMKEFAAALPPAPPRRRGPARVAAELRARRRRRIAAAAAALLALAAAAVVAIRRADSRTPPLDPTLYAVLPFTHDAGAAPGLVTGSQCERLVHDALARWRGVRLVNEMRVNDALARRTPPRTLEDALAVARSLGAGVLLWGRLVDVGDSISVGAALYQVPRRPDDGQTEPRTQATVRLPKSLSGAGAAFDSLAQALLIGTPSTVTAADGAMGTRSIDAWRAYERGHAALAAWELPQAAAAFDSATRIDPAYAHASLWLARSQLWAGEPAAVWRAAAARAYTDSARLSERDRLDAAGLFAMASGRYPEACRLARAVLARDSLDFAAWYALGECHARDRAVLRDPTSPTGWRFRSSYRTAIAAYQRALELVPSSYLAFQGAAFARLPRLLFTETNRSRRGFLAPGDQVPSDTTWFAAYPALHADTLAFVPIPYAQFSAAGPGTEPPTLYAAVARNREVLHHITGSWVRTFPQRATAHEIHALALESLGRLDGATPADGALPSVRRARRLAAPEDAHVRLALMEARLLLKLGRFAEARAVADSLLAANAAPPPAVAGQLAAAAALTGRMHRTAALLRAGSADSLVLADGRQVAAPPEAAAAAAHLTAYAAMGGPTDSITALTDRVGQLVSRGVTADARDAVRDALIPRFVWLAVPRRGRAPLARTGGSYLLRMHDALAEGDTASVRRELVGIRDGRRRRPTDAFPPDGVYHEARVALTVGDTATATELLDRALGALGALDSRVLDRPSEAAGLVRAMALRADLAHAQGDGAAARRWAAPVVTFWSDADRELSATVARMRALMQ